MTIMNGKDGLRSFAGDDVTDTFPVTFPFQGGAASLIVVLRGIADSLPAFVVNGTAAQQRAGAATITTAVVPATAETLIVVRAMPAEQGSDYSDAAAFPSDDVEARLDYLTMAIGDVQRTLDRALLGDWLDTAPHQFPAEAVRAGKIVSFDDDGVLETLHPVAGFVGPAFAWDASGTLAGRDAFDAQAEGYAYLATDTDPPLLYIRVTAVAGTWSDPIRFFSADVGEASILRVPASGVDQTAPDALVITTAHLPSAAADQVKLRFVFEAANTGAMTLEARQSALVSWGAKALVDLDQQPLAPNVVAVGMPSEAVWSAALDKWVWLGPSNLDEFVTATGLAATLADYAQPAAKQSWTRAQRPGEEAVAYAATWAPDLSLAPLKTVAALTGSFQIDLPVGCHLWDVFTIVLLQDGTGGRAITMDAGYVNQPAAFVADPDKRQLIDCMVTAVTGTDATEAWVLGAPIEE